MDFADLLDAMTPPKARRCYFLSVALKPRHPGLADLMKLCAQVLSA